MPDSITLFSSRTSTDLWLSGDLLGYIKSLNKLKGLI